MRIEGDVLVFHSLPEWYDKERIGMKPNTVRLLDRDEVQAIEDSDIKYVRIERVGDSSNFLRLVVGLWSLGVILDKTLFMVCWLP